MKIDGEELIDALRSAFAEPHSYSGRAMYGKECVSVHCDSDSDLWDLAVALTERGVKPGGPRTEGLGRQIVAYWPAIAWPETRTDHNDWDDGDGPA